MSNRIHPAIKIIMAFVLCFLVAYWFLVLPKAKEMGELMIAADQVNVDALKKGTSTPVLGGIKNEDALLAKRLLPAEDKQYDLAVQIEALVKVSGVTLTSMAINGADSSLPKTSTAAAATTAATTAGADALGMKKVLVTLAVSGSYANVQRFVVGLHQIDRLIQVDQISLNAASAPASGSSFGGTPNTTTAGTSDQVASQITAFAYYMPATTAASSATTAASSATTTTNTSSK